MIPDRSYEGYPAVDPGKCFPREIASGSRARCALQTLTQGTRARLTILPHYLIEGITTELGPTVIMPLTTLIKGVLCVWRRADRALALRSAIVAIDRRRCFPDYDWAIWNAYWRSGNPVHPLGRFDRSRDYTHSSAAWGKEITDSMNKVYDLLCQV